MFATGALLDAAAAVEQDANGLTGSAPTTVHLDPPLIPSQQLPPGEQVVGALIDRAERRRVILGQLRRRQAASRARRQAVLRRTVLLRSGAQTGWR